jgi:23S rRNA-/tRNA-specific pseudouridylate synthase
VRVATGERVTVHLEAPDVPRLTADDLVVAFRAEDLVIVEKPPGVPVAATREAATGSLSETLIAWLTTQGVVRPYVGVVHRLDQPASGLVLFTTRGAANPSVHRLFVDHAIERVYRLRVEGEPPASFVVDAPLVEARAGHVRVATPGEPGAMTARTRLTRLLPADGDPTALLEARLDTGRRHQIRVHAAHAGHPIVGDRRYGAGAAETSDDASDLASAGDAPEVDGSAAAMIGGDGPSATPEPTAAIDRVELRLHAHELRFTHPITGELVHARSTLPPWAR